MLKLSSSNPLFVELLYGVVVGSSVALLSPGDFQVLLFQVSWLVAVLEDWFLYHSFVVDAPDTAVSFDFTSLLIEFSILLSWYLGFSSLKDQNTWNTFFLCASSFYLLKIVGSLPYYYKKGKLLSQLHLCDCAWLIPVALGFWLYVNPQHSFADSLGLFYFMTAGSVVSWWYLSNSRRTP